MQIKKLLLKLEKFVARYGEKSLDTSNMHLVERTTFVIFSPPLSVLTVFHSLPPTSYALFVPRARRFFVWFFKN